MWSPEKLWAEGLLFCFLPGEQLKTGGCPFPQQSSYREAVGAHWGVIYKLFGLWGWVTHLMGKKWLRFLCFVLVYSQLINCRFTTVTGRFIGKDPDIGKDWRQKEKRTAEDEMVGWHHRLNGMNLHKIWGIVGDREACRAAVHGSQRVGHDLVTEQQQR